jgi:5-methylcytosine-specific restriction endonuclease McrA
MSKYSANGSTRAWKALRKRILERDPWCAICQREPATEVDHLIPLKEAGPRFDPANVRGVCHGCHVRRHGKRPRRLVDPATGLPYDTDGWIKF